MAVQNIIIASSTPEASDHDGAGALELTINAHRRAWQNFVRTDEANDAERAPDAWGYAADAEGRARQQLLSYPVTTLAEVRMKATYLIDGDGRLAETLTEDDIVTVLRSFAG